MIQRIQTLYLFLVVALGITLCFVPVLQLDTPEEAAVQRMWEVSAIGMEDVMPVEDAPAVQLQGLAGLLVISALIPLLALVDIFLFKKLAEQIKRRAVFIDKLEGNAENVFQRYDFKHKVAVCQKKEVLYILAHAAPINRFCVAYRECVSCIVAESAVCTGIFFLCFQIWLLINSVMDLYKVLVTLMA